MLLSLDTATRHSGLALYDGQQIVAELNWHSVDAQTTELLPRLEQLMTWRGLQPADLAALAVSLGPGSFTGVRVAVSLAKGMALAQGLPLLGVPTLDATAYPHLGHGEPVCAVVQAGRGRVLWSIYRPGPPTDGAHAVELGDWHGSCTPIALTDHEGLRAAIDRRTLLVGELTPDLRALLAERTGDLAELAGPAVATRRAGYVAELAWLRWQAGQADDPATPQPHLSARAMSCWTPRLRRMEPRDLPAVLAIEETVFGDDAWSRSFFQRDLANEHAIYFVLELLEGAVRPERAELAGYAGYWLLEDEANLMNIAIAPDWQGRGLGEYLLLETLALVQERGVEVCTLEVRVSNVRAQALYRKLGFQVEGRRLRYYQDNGEDALIMTTPPLDSPAIQQLHSQQQAALRTDLTHRLCS